MKYTAITYVHSHKIDYEIRTIVINNKQHQLHCEKKKQQRSGLQSSCNIILCAFFGIKKVLGLPETKSLVRNEG